MVLGWRLLQHPVGDTLEAIRKPREFITTLFLQCPQTVHPRLSTFQSLPGLVCCVMMRFFVAIVLVVVIVVFICKKKDREEWNYYIDRTPETIPCSASFPASYESRQFNKYLAYE